MRANGGADLIRTLLVATVACGCAPAAPPAVDAATFLVTTSSADEPVLPADGRVHYVAPDDRADGDAGDPFRTISRAPRASRPGDVVLVRPGHYFEEVEIRASGEDGRPIRFLPESEGTVTLDGARTP